MVMNTLLLGLIQHGRIRQVTLREKDVEAIHLALQLMYGGKKIQKTTGFADD